MRSDSWLVRSRRLSWFITIKSPLLQVCENMKKIRLKHVLEALQRNQYQIEVEPEIAYRAKRALDEMLRYV